MPTAEELTLPAAGRAMRAVLKAVPVGVWNWLGRKAPTNSLGHRLAPELAGAVAVLNRIPGNDFSTKPIPEARAQLREEGLLFADTFPPFAIVDDEIRIPGPGGDIPATRYRAHNGQPRGLIIYFHGGGWVLGDRVSTDSAVRFLASFTGADVLSVDYRLAPEHPFPAAIEDALAAYDYAVDKCREWGIAPERLVVAGDSAGANISAVLGLELRDHPFRPCLQVLFSPAVDLAHESASYEELADGFFLTRDQIRWYKQRYLSDPAHALDPRVSPALAEDHTNLPPAYVGVAGFDPLRDEGIAYAKLLTDAGNQVTLHVAGSVIHPYINVTGFSSAARQAAEHAASAIVAALEAVE